MPFDQQATDQRHSERRRRLQQLRDDFNRMIDYWWESVPRSSAEEGSVEYKIEEDLIRFKHKIDDFMRYFKGKPNE